MTGILLRRSVKEETVQMAERLGAEGVFVLALLPNGVRSSFTGTPGASIQIPSLLRAMADDYERKMGRI